MRTLAPRLPAVDFLKGLLIFSVLLGHALQYFIYDDNGAFWADPTFQAIYLFHMPLFMAVSGFLAAAKPSSANAPNFAEIKRYILHRGKHLLVPMAIYATLITLLQTFAVPQPPETTFLGHWFSNLFLVYWFITCVFLIGLLFQLFPANPKRQLRVILIVATLLVFLPVHQLPNPFGLLLSFLGFMFPFFAIGYLWRTRKLHPPRGRPMLIVTGLLTLASYALFATSQMKDFVYVNQLNIWGNAPHVLHMFASGIIVSALVTIVVLTLYCHLSPRLARPVEAWGRHSLNIYLMQTLLLTVYAAIPHQSWGGWVAAILNASIVWKIPLLSPLANTFTYIALYAILLALLFILFIEALLWLSSTLRRHVPAPAQKRRA